MPSPFSLSDSFFFFFFLAFVILSFACLLFNFFHLLGHLFYFLLKTFHLLVIRLLLLFQLLAFLFLGAAHLFSHPLQLTPDQVEFGFCISNCFQSLLPLVFFLLLALFLILRGNCARTNFTLLWFSLLLFPLFWCLMMMILNPSDDALMLLTLCSLD